MSHSNTISRPLVRLPEWMEDALSVASEQGEPRSEQNRRISEVIEREQRRLFQFIRKRVGDPGDAEDILQDVFYELIEAYRLMQPIEQIGAWLYRVARNRIVDRFRKRRPNSGSGMAVRAADEDALEDLLPSPDAGPEAAYARTILIEEIEAAIGDLPQEQRSVFIAHELEGRSFKQIADETGLNINTLLSRKRYATLHLRRRLKAIYDEFMSA
jgi:RNA polymerase sigma factor (sigma-70 family)